MIIATASISGSAISSQVAMQTASETTTAGRCCHVAGQQDRFALLNLRERERGAEHPQRPGFRRGSCLGTGGRKRGIGRSTGAGRADDVTGSGSGRRLGLGLGFGLRLRVGLRGWGCCRG